MLKGYPVFTKDFVERPQQGYNCVIKIIPENFLTRTYSTARLFYLFFKLAVA